MNTISNVPGSIEWLVYKGDTASLTIIMKDQDGKDLDISGLSFTGQIKLQPEDEEEEQTLTIATNENVITVVIPDTSILSKMSYFDIHSTNNVTDEVMTILKGRISAEMDVTRP
jgi:hypothetical protein